MSEHAEEPLTPVKRALIEIRRLKARLAAAEGSVREPVAVVGMAIRGPGGVSDLDGFWRLLTGGEDGLSLTPPARWDAEALYHPEADEPGRSYSRHGGYLENPALFDAEFFGISPREAESMDPQHRLLLEVCWEALENAAIAPSTLSGKRAGVFIGLCNSDYGRLLLQDREDVDAYTSFGAAASIAAGRLSYFLNTRGPSLTVDTACSSSLTAIHMACNSLHLGESDFAIVGAANLMLSPDVTVSFSKARMLARDGRCKTFDAKADGYVRGEGCAVVLLKRLSRALSDGDRVLAQIAGSAINHDGRSAGLTAPNGPAQEAVIRAAVTAAGITPDQVDYVEAHGTGTPLGDPIEVQALASAYGEGRAPSQPLLIGSVKTVVGHLEAAAGLAGLLKVILGLQHGQIPPHRNLDELNPRIDWASLPVRVADRALPWPPGERVRRAGLSAFGFSGTNIHVIVEEAPPAPPAAESVAPELFCLSARSADALRSLAARYVHWLARTSEPLADICYSAAAGRSHHEHRLALLARDVPELKRALEAWMETSDRAPPAEPAEGPRQIALFAPAIAAAPEAAPALRTAFPAFAAIWDEFVAEVGTPLALEGKEAHRARAVALQICLGRFWMALGLEPLAAFGAGAGEIAAACLAGLVTPGRAMEAARGGELVASPGTGERLFVSTRSGLRERGPAEAEAEGEPGRIADAAAVARQHGAEIIVALGPLSDAPPALADACGSGHPLSRDGVLATARELYRRGCPIRWEALYRGQGRRRLAMPIYPFQHKSFWRPKPGSRSAAAAQPLWPDIAAVARQQSESGPLGWSLTQYEQRWSRLEDLTAGAALNTLAGLGAFQRAGEILGVDELISEYGVAPRHRNLVNRWLSLLARKGLIEPHGGVFRNARPLRPQDLSPVWTDVEALLADDPDILSYTRNASNRLRDFVTGRANPLEVLFARGSFDTAEGVYSRSPSARYLNAIVAATVRTAVQQTLPEGHFRLLEVGAGTGGTTAAIAPFFPASGEYWFTDVSDAFLSRARRKFGGNPAFRFAPYNLDGTDCPEGLLPGFDVVLAANVVHAARDVEASLGRLRALLKPGGLLVLVETTTHHSIFDLTIGFVEGWSNFADRRTEHPLLAADEWTSVLKDVGFATADRFPAEGSPANLVGQHVILAQNGADCAVASAQSASNPSAAGESRRPALVAPLPAEASASHDGDRLAALVRGCAAEVMHLDPAAYPGDRDRFSDLGMDSLMALQLKAMLTKGLDLDEHALPATIAFDAGTVEELTRQLLHHLVPASPSGAARLPSPGELSAQEVAALSDGEAEALLAARLAHHSELVRTS